MRKKVDVHDILGDDGELRIPLTPPEEPSDNRRPSEGLIYTVGTLIILVIIAIALLLSSIKSKQDALSDARTEVAEEVRQTVFPESFSRATRTAAALPTDSRLPVSSIVSEIRATATVSPTLLPSRTPSATPTDILTPIPMQMHPIEATWTAAPPAASHDLPGLITVENAFRLENLMQLDRGSREGVNFLQWSPDVRRIAIADATSIQVYEISRQVRLNDIPYDSLVMSFGWSPDGTKLAIGGGNNGWLWVESIGATLRYKRHAADIVSMAWSPNSNYLATGSKDGSIVIWDTANTDYPIYAVHEVDYPILSLSWSPDGRQLAVLHAHHLILMDVHSGKFKTLEALTGTIAVWSPDGASIALVQNNVISIVDVGTLTVKNQLMGHTYQVTSLDWSPDSYLLVSGSRDRTVRIWDSSSGPELNQFTAPDKREMKYVDWSPDGRYIAAAGLSDAILIWGIPQP